MANASVRLLQPSARPSEHVHFILIFSGNFPGKLFSPRLFTEGLKGDLSYSLFHKVKHAHDKAFADLFTREFFSIKSYSQNVLFQ